MTEWAFSPLADQVPLGLELRGNGSLAVVCDPVSGLYVGIRPDRIPRDKNDKPDLQAVLRLLHY